MKEGMRVRGAGWRSLFDRSFWMFLLIGAGNTLLAQIIMQGLYGIGLDYWFSSAIAFALTSVLGYALNRRFSFRDTRAVKKTLWRFALVVGVCYLIAYSAAQPAARWLLARLPGTAQAETRVIDRAALLVGQVVFTGLNYLGQRFFAFQSK